MLCTFVIAIKHFSKYLFVHFTEHKHFYYVRLSYRPGRRFVCLVGRIAVHSFNSFDAQSLAEKNHLYSDPPHWSL